MNQARAFVYLSFCVIKMLLNYRHLRHSRLGEEHRTLETQDTNPIRKNIHPEEEPRKMLYLGYICVTHYLSHKNLCKTASIREKYVVISKYSISIGHLTVRAVPGYFNYIWTICIYWWRLSFEKVLPHWTGSIVFHWWNIWCDWFKVKNGVCVRFFYLE